LRGGVLLTWEIKSCLQLIVTQSNIILADIKDCSNVIGIQENEVHLVACFCFKGNSFLLLGRQQFEPVQSFNNSAVAG